MSRLIVPALLSAAAVSLAAVVPGGAAAQTVRVFILSGQSNADGLPQVTGFPRHLWNQPQTLFFPNSSSRIWSQYGFWRGLQGNFSSYDGCGPELSLGHDLRSLYPGDEIAIIKHAFGGHSLHEQFRPGGDATFAGDGQSWQRLQTTVQTAMDALRTTVRPNAAIRLQGMAWVQGESDALFPEGHIAATGYGAALSAFIDEARLTFQTPDLAFVATRLADTQLAVSGPRPQNFATVRAAQELPRLNYRWADIDGATIRTEDYIHFEGPGMVLAGERLAAGFYELDQLSVPEPAYWPLGLAALSALALASAGRVLRRSAPRR